MDKQSLNVREIGALTGLNGAQLREIIGMFVANPNASLTRGELGEILQSMLQLTVDGGGGGGGAVETTAPITGTGTSFEPIALADGGVTSVKLADNAVTTNKINNLAVVEGKIATSAVTSGKIANGAVGTTKIADLAVTNGKIADGTISFAKWGANGASVGQIPRYNGTAWIPSAENVGSGGGGLPEVYDAGNGAMVVASALGVTFTYGSGVGIFSVPEGVLVYSARIHGVGDNLTNGNLDVELGWVSGTPPYNANLASIYPPIIMKYNRILPENNPGTFPWEYDIDNTPRVLLTGVNGIKFRIENLTGIANWGVRIQFI
jgi:hypothetical protein